MEAAPLVELGEAAEPEAEPLEAGLLAEAEAPEETGRVAVLTGPGAVARVVALPVADAEPEALPEAPPAPPAHIVCWSWRAAACSSGVQADTHVVAFVMKPVSHTQAA